MNKIGNFLTELRKEKGFTQQEVADALSVSNKTVSKWERSEGYPEIETLVELARLFDISVDELIEGKKSFQQSSNSLNDLLELDSEKKKIISLGISGIALLIFFALYFFQNDFSLALFIYLSIMCVSLIILVIGILKVKKYHLEQKFIYFDWIRNFVCLTIFTVPCFNFQSILSVDALNAIISYISKVNLYLGSSTSNFNSTLYNFTISINVGDFFRILPILIFISLIIFQIFNLIKASMTKKNVKIQAILVSILLLIFIANIGYQITKINTPDHSVTMESEEYSKFKNTFIDIYVAYQKSDPTYLVPYEEGKKIDFTKLTPYLSTEKRREIYGNILSFDDTTYTVNYKADFTETLNRVDKSINSTIALSSTLLIINGIALLLYKKRNVA